MAYQSVGWANPIGPTIVNSAGYFDPIFTDRSLGVYDGGQAWCILDTPSTEVWFSTRLTKETLSGVSGSSPSVVIFDDHGNMLFQLIIANNNGASIFRYIDTSDVSSSGNGTYVDAMSDTYGNDDPSVFNRAFNTDITTKMDVHLVSNAGAGMIEVFINDDPLFRATGLDNGGNPIRRAFMSVSNYSNNSTNLRNHWSEWFFGTEAGYTTIGKRPITKTPDGDSATNTAWVGSFTDVNSQTSDVTGSGIYSDTGGQAQTFTFPAISNNDLLVETVALLAYGTIGIDGGGPSDYESYARVSGSNYSGTAFSPTIVYGQHQGFFDLNPDTGNRWTPNEIDASEFGVISVV